MSEAWIGFGVVACVLACAVIAATSRYRRAHRRAELLRNLDHHEWWYWTHASAAGSRSVKR
ncbi:hypothetical protein [Burkholderia stagnalis]|uniref:Uncharacterized protein n=1 Tax=Burkholderia stagnalis TaxID=1503054 RepID=A0A6L3N1N7_9BURK|nr:hypothetical protein [Burkholderia stagnalis]KAB0640018.1 hypothetical protein F7R25_06810 [Burkholderia stagnalis]RQQ35713.1 hypothetical protein DF163_03400 [Burkholderia stagnalis]RQQ39372.1 hypothetical protein DF149_00205 [Burkholderia stagnalis]RQQ54851.1 hypothetical protein DF162_03880 [Burkholderia stagnalis]RQY04416.1 hypothetical protein DF119_01780 [Burkholderia stagnalis]